MNRVILYAVGKTVPIYRRSVGIRLLRRSLGLLVSVVLVSYLFRYVDVKEFVATVSNVPLYVLPTAFGIYLFLNLCRTLRFRTLLDQKKLSLKIFFPITLCYNFLLRTLPFMAGEISYIALLRRYLGQRVSAGVSSLISARLFDLLFIILGGSAVLLTMHKDGLEISTRLMLLLASCLSLVGLAIYFAASVLRFTVKLWGKVAGIGVWRRWRFVTLIGERLEEVPTQFEHIRQPGIFCRTLVLSLGVYGANIGFNILLLRAAAINQSIETMIAIITMVMIASLIPLSVSGFGVIEGGWTVSLVLLGNLEPAQATTLSFFLHGSQVIATSLSGLIGYLLLQIATRSTFNVLSVKE